MTVAPLPMPALDPPGWRRVWSCDFSQGDVALGGFVTRSTTWGQLAAPTAYAPLLQAYPSSWKDTSKRGTYDAKATAAVVKGVLTIKPYTDPTGVTRVCAFQPVTPPLRFGRYTERWRVTNPSASFKFALLMWPQDESWPAHGEIDWPEFDTFAGQVKSAVCRPQAGPAVFDVIHGQALADGAWHTTTTEVTPAGVRCYLDGVLFSTVPTVMPTPMRRVWQVETAINSTPIDPAARPVVEFDWLTVSAPV